jgi:cytochrome P450
MPPDVTAEPDLASPTFKADPFPFYEQLRRANPVHRIHLRNAPRAWLVTRYSDVLAVLKDEWLVKDPQRVKGATRVGPPWLPRRCGR